MDPSVDVPLLVIAGYSGSGKTTLIERLLPELRRRGLRLGVLKHHGHALALDTAGKDSDRFWQAGAEAVAMLSPERTVLMWRSEPAEDLQELANRLGVDLVLAEGFKRTHWPRLLVLGERPEEAEELGQGRPVLAAIGSIRGKSADFSAGRERQDESSALRACPEHSEGASARRLCPALGCPLYSPDDIAGIADCVEGWLRSRRDAGAG